MINNNIAIDEREVLLVSIEQIRDEKLSDWKDFLNRIAAEGIAMVTIESDKISSGEAFNSHSGENTVRIVCTAEWFLHHLNELRDHDEEGMLSVHRAYKELEDLYYEGE